MNRRTAQRFAAAGASAALIATGMSVAVGGGVASAAAEGECDPTSVTELGMGLSGRDLTVTQTVDTPEVPAGGELTIRTSIAGDGAVVGVKRMRDNLPAGFVFDSAAVDGHDVTARVKADSSASTAYVDAGSAVEWLTSRANPVVFETVYSVPEDVQVGSAHRVGFGLSVALSGANDWNFADSGACFTIRPQNPVESAAGSLEDLGLGSINSGSGQIFGSLTDPQGSIAGVINQLDFGKIIGGAMGS